MSDELERDSAEAGEGGITHQWNQGLARDD